MRIDTHAPRATIEDIRDFECRHGITLPRSYVTFLLAHNGGTPIPSIYTASDGTKINVGLLLPITGDGIARTLSVFPTCLEDDWMPIGLTGGGDYFALSLASGAIYLWRHELDVDGDEQSLTFLEPDVNSLLNSIEDSEEDLGGDEIEEVIKSGSVLRIEGYLRQNPIDRKNKIGYSLVQEAARAGNLAIVKYCLQQGASCKGLMCAGARSERREVIDYLLDEVGLDVNDPDEDGRTPLSYVVFDDEIHDYLVSRGAHE